MSYKAPIILFKAIQKNSQTIIKMQENININFTKYPTTNSQTLTISLEPFFYEQLHSIHFILVLWNKKKKKFHSFRLKQQKKKQIELCLSNIYRIISINYNYLLKTNLTNYIYSSYSPIQSSENLGDFDETFGTNGWVNLTTNDYKNYRSQIIRTIPNGSLFIGLSQSKTGDSSILSKYKKDGQIDLQFGQNGYVLFGKQTRMAHAMYVDDKNRIFIGGCNEADGGVGWLNCVALNGKYYDTIINSQDISNEWVFIGSIAAQKSGKLIVLGQLKGQSKYIRIARYNFDFTIDVTFGNSGYILFDGNTPNIPHSVTILYSMVITKFDTLYIPYIDINNDVYVAKFLVNGEIDTNWGSNGSVHLSLLKNATNYQLHIAIDYKNNLIIAAQVQTNIYVTSLTLDGQSNSTFVDYSFNTTENIYDTYNITHLVTVCNNIGTKGNIFLIGYNSTKIQCFVVCLNENGQIDTNYYQPSGYNQFNIQIEDVLSSSLTNAVIASSGNLYTVGYEINNEITTPYIMRFCYNIGTEQVKQYPNREIRYACHME